jgi:hypothetical protein
MIHHELALKGSTYTPILGEGADEVSPLDGRRDAHLSTALSRLRIGQGSKVVAEGSHAQQFASPPSSTVSVMPMSRHFLRNSARY